jgi:hypothetical protein
MTKANLPLSASDPPFDKQGSPERSSGGSSGIRIGRAYVRLVEGDARRTAPRAQGEALRAIAHSLGLVDEMEDD